MIIVPSNVSAAPKVLTFKGAEYGDASSLTLPSHSAGDLIVYFCTGSTTVQNAPASSGTIPAWTMLTYAYDAGYNQFGAIFYAIATASNHTSGTFQYTQSSIAFVVSGQNQSTPIGDYNLMSSYKYSNNTSLSIPAITPQKTDGTSLFVQLSQRLQYTTGPFTAATGYTAWPRSSDSTYSYQHLAWTKNSSTSDGAVTPPNVWSGNSSWFSPAQLEILL